MPCRPWVRSPAGRIPEPVRDLDLAVALPVDLTSSRSQGTANARDPAGSLRFPLGRRPDRDRLEARPRRLRGGQGQGRARCRRPGEARPLVRGPRNERRAPQTPDARHAHQPRPRHGPGPAGPGLQRRKMAEAGRGPQPDRERSQGPGRPPRIPRAPGEHARSARRPVEARPLVREPGTERASPGAL